MIIKMSQSYIMCRTFYNYANNGFASEIKNYEFLIIDTNSLNRQIFI